MNDIENDIFEAKKLIDNSDKKQIFSSIYPFTTENIKEYYDLFNFNNKDILTIGSSGDHTLNLYLKNARTIDFFDVSPFSKYYFDLKFNSIKTLSHKEFLKFFCLNYPTSYDIDEYRFNKELYSKIKLEGNSKIFWDTLFKEYDSNKIRESCLFTKDEAQLSILLKINSYLNKKNYEKLKLIKKKNHEFINTDLSNLPNKLTKNYDVIMLSNIAQYNEMNPNIKTLEKFKEIVLKLADHVNDNGIIFLSYIYDVLLLQKQTSISEIYNLNKIEELFGKEYIYQFEINSIQNVLFKKQNQVKDGILIYKK